MKRDIINKTSAIVIMSGFIFNPTLVAASVHDYTQSESGNYYDLSSDNSFPSTEKIYFDADKAKNVELDNITIAGDDAKHSYFGHMSNSSFTVNHLAYSGTGNIDRFFELVISSLKLTDSQIETNSSTVFFGGNTPSLTVVNSSVHNTNANGSMFTSPYGTGPSDIKFISSVDNSHLISDGVLVDTLARDMTLNVANGSTLISNTLANSEKFVDVGYLTINLSNSTLLSGINQDNGSKVTMNLTDGSSFSLTGDTAVSQIQEINMSGQSSLNFIDEEGQYKTLKVNVLTSDQSGNVIHMNTDLSSLQGDFLDIGQASGQYTLDIKDSGKEAQDKVLDLIHVTQGEKDQFILKDGQRGIDAGTYVYFLSGKANGDEHTWTLNQNKPVDPPVDPVDPPVDPVDPPVDPVDPPVDPVDPPVEPSVPPVKPMTTPSTDAVLSMAAGNQFIFDGELQNLRYRKGDLRNAKGDTGGVWGRYLTNNSRVNAAANASFRLQQDGMEIGADKVVNLNSGNLIMGLFVGYSNNLIKHARQGRSNIDSYTFGGYATYLDQSGYYIDSVLKFNRFHNDLRAVSTQGDDITGDYNQMGYGGALEAGYQVKLNSLFIEPYVRATYFNANGKSIELNNGMKADIDDNRSARGEAGVVLGNQWTLANGSLVSPYVKLGIEREFIKSNKVRINDTNDFNNNFSGNIAKYGAGLDVQLTKQSSVYIEADYRKGKHVESPIMANVGFRISF